MKAKDLFMKTISFCWMKLGLGLLNIVIDIILFAILMGISMIFNNDGVIGIMFLIWLGLIGIVNFAVNHYLGYLVKAGHVAVIADSFKTGSVPDNCVAVGKNMVKERFGTANVYFVIDKLISGAVKQIQRILGRITDTVLGSLPGAETLKSATNFFLKISLGYIDECCLGYTFYQNEQNPYKSGCDGVVIYAQNWKVLLKNAAVTAITVIVALVAITLVSFALFAALFKLFGWSGFVAFVVAFMLAWTVKYAFIDSWMMVKMMHGYMQVAPNTVITTDLYAKLSGFSSKFRDMFRKSGTTATEATVVTPTPRPTIATTAAAEIASPEVVVVATDEIVTTNSEGESNRPRFCPECGTPLSSDMVFCGNCGKKIG